MRPGVVFAGFLALMVSVGLVVWLVQGKSIPSTADTKVPPVDPAKPEAPQLEDVDITPPTKPPFPKAVVDETEFKFGTMSVGSERTHDFYIRNEGEGPLKIKQGEKTCQCTLSELENNQVAPGDSVKVTLTWKPAGETEEFDKWVEIKTNDKDNPSIKLHVQGVVVARFIVQPAGTWNMLDVRDDAETEFQGIVASGAAKFQITSIEAENPALQAEAESLSDEELQKHEFAAGYRVMLKLAPTLPVGSFSIPLKIKTDLPTQDGNDTETAEVVVTGNRRGPLRIIGKDWVEEVSGVYLGSFNASEGRKISLVLIAHGEPPEGLQFTSVESEVSDLKVSLEPDTQYKGAKRYRLHLEYPAGSAAAAHRESNPAIVNVKTNHPQAGEVQLKVYFVAL